MKTEANAFLRRAALPAVGLTLMTVCALALVGFVSPQRDVQIPSRLGGLIPIADLWRHSDAYRGRTVRTVGTLLSFEPGTDRQHEVLESRDKDRVGLRKLSPRDRLRYLGQRVEAEGRFDESTTSGIYIDIAVLRPIGN